MKERKNVDVLDDIERELADIADVSNKSVNDNIDIVRVMQTPEGERLLRRILAFTRLFAVSYCRGDSHETAYREGRRQVGLWLLSAMGEADQALCTRVINGARNGHNSADSADPADRS